MKKMSFALIAIAVIAVLSAFVTKTSTTATPFKYHAVGTQFTNTQSPFEQRQPVLDLTSEVLGEGYDCITPSEAECTFLNTAEAEIISSQPLSIPVTDYNNRTSVVSGDFQ